MKLTSTWSVGPVTLRVRHALLAASAAFLASGFWVGLNVDGQAGLTLSYLLGSMSGPLWAIALLFYIQDKRWFEFL